MPSDLELIEQLEKEIGTKLPRRDFDKIMRYERRGYSTDRQGRVNGLNLTIVELKAIPSVVARFRYLERLRLYDTQISDLTPLAGLTNLGFLDLSYNKITALPPQILDLDLEINVANDIPFADKLYLHGNPLEKPPPEIIKQGKDAVRAYFQALEKEEHLPLQEAKILLVGDGGAGKTSLVKRMLGLDFDPKEDQTHGINIRKWVVTAGENEIIAHLWDFGGQEIMHATHQFFLSKRSLYILVLDGRRDEKTEYWLKLIESFGGDSPVLVVLNKMDQNPGFDINRNFLQQKYENIKGFFRLSCANSEGIQSFVTALVLV
jgi:small GTP-binding protein